jgi:hypothetical protein
MMNEEEVKYPNVSLKGKRNKQKAELDSTHQRYGQKNQTDVRNRG